MAINRICKKYLRLTFSSKRLRDINPAHSSRHSCAVRMLFGKPVSEIKIRLGHENIQSTMTYLHMDLTRKRDVQNKFIAYSASSYRTGSKDRRLNRLGKQAGYTGLAGLAVTGCDPVPDHPRACRWELYYVDCFLKKPRNDP